MTHLTADGFRAMPATIVESTPTVRTKASGRMVYSVTILFCDGSTIRLFARSPKRLRRQLRYYKQVPLGIVKTVIPPVVLQQQPPAPATKQTTGGGLRRYMRGRKTKSPG